MKTTTTALSTLAMTIERQHREAQTHSTKTGLACWECGQALIEAKREVAYGKWRGWVADNLSFGTDYATKYMKIGRLDQACMRDLKSLSACIRKANSGLIDTREDRARATYASITALMIGMVEAGYRALSKSHPQDTKAQHAPLGGAHEKMSHLTHAKDELFALIDSNRRS